MSKPVKIPSWWTRATIWIEQPNGEPMIRQACLELHKRINPSESLKRRLVNTLLSWCEDHAPHPSLPEWANRSYLPIPIAELMPLKTLQEIENKLKPHHVRFIFETGRFFAPEVEGD